MTTVLTCWNNVFYALVFYFIKCSETVVLVAPRFTSQVSNAILLWAQRERSAKNPASQPTAGGMTTLEKQFVDIRGDKFSCGLSMSAFCKHQSLLAKPRGKSDTLSFQVHHLTTLGGWLSAGSETSLPSRGLIVVVAIVAHREATLYGYLRTVESYIVPMVIGCMHSTE